MKFKMKTKKKMKTKMAENEAADPKAQLVLDICSISLASAACPHRRSRRSSPGKQFIDWYLILKVDEDAGLDVIRRRYRQLALQVHPDKNRHPKAEVAFKILSEAYGCLSDAALRQAFNSVRLYKLCKECRAKKTQQSLQKSQQRSSHYDTSREPPPPPQAARWRRSLMVLREVQKRLHEECRVVERCLQANQVSRSEGFPLFNPSDPTVYPDYPHQRSRVSIPPEYTNCFTSRDIRNYFGKKLCESPLYELRPDYR